jgi:hypothetical protein
MKTSLYIACLLSLAACSATGHTPATDASGRVVGVKELPAENSELLRAYARGGEEWSEAKGKALARPELARFLVDNLTLEMLRAYRAFGGVDHDRAQRAFLRAKGELVSMPEHSAPVLVALLEVADPVAADVASAALEEIGKPAIEPTLALVSHADVDVRQRAALLLGHLPPGGAALEPRVRDTLVQRLANEPDWLARASLAKTVGRRGSLDTVATPWREALERALGDTDPAVMDAAAEGLVELGDERAIPVLIDVLERSSKAGQLARFGAAQRALLRLSGQPEKPSIAAWREWWAARAR